MGKTFLGGSERKENIDLLSPDQSGFLSGALGSQGNEGPYAEFLQPYNQQEFGDLFQKSFIDPAMQNLQRNVIPGLKEGFLGLDESGSGSLNRALAQSATDVSTGIGQQYMNMFQNMQSNKINALGQMGGLAGQRTFEPWIENTEGILGPLIAAIGKIGAGFAGGGAPGALMGAINSAGSAGAQTAQRPMSPGQPTGARGGGGQAWGRYS